jgi:hypothetical protein
MIPQAYLLLESRIIESTNNFQWREMRSLENNYRPRFQVEKVRK